LVVNWLTTP